MSRGRGRGRGRAGGQAPHGTLSVSCRESIVSLKRKYLKHEAEEGVSLSQPSMDGVLDAIAKEGCGSLLEEVFLDLEVGALSPAPRWALPTRCRIDTLPGSVPSVSGWELVVVTGKYWTEPSTAHSQE